MAGDGADPIRGGLVVLALAGHWKSIFVNRRDQASMPWECTLPNMGMAAVPWGQ
jgi:hypothetical protein